MGECFLSCDSFLACEIYCKIYKIAYISSSFAFIIYVISLHFPPFQLQNQGYTSLTQVKRNLVILILASGFPRLAHFRELTKSTLSIRSECPYHHGEHIKKDNSGENVTVEIQHNLKNDTKTILKEKTGKRQIYIYIQL